LSSGRCKDYQGRTAFPEDRRQGGDLGTQLARGKQKEKPEEAILVEFAEKKAEAPAMTPPFLFQILAVNRVGMDRDVFRQDILKNQVRTLHMVTGRDQLNGTDLFLHDKFSCLNSVFQGIPGNLLQKNSFPTPFTGPFPKEIGFAHKGVDTDEKQPVCTVFPVQLHPFFDTPPAARQNNDSIRCDLPLSDGKGFIGKINEEDYQRYQENG
jgi:hypothetical protein